MGKTGAHSKHPARQQGPAMEPQCRVCKSEWWTQGGQHKEFAFMEAKPTDLRLTRLMMASEEKNKVRYRNRRGKPKLSVKN